MDIRRGLIVLMFFVMMGSFVVGAGAASDELIVKYKESYSMVNRLSSLSTVLPEDSYDSIEIIKVADGQNVDTLIDFYSSMSNVEYVEKNDKFDFHLVPNDPSYSSQWYLPKIQSEESWDLTFGNESVIIAIVDSGVEWSHLDLANNIWNNTDEDCDNSTDLDGNGYFGDCRGYDFTDTSNIACIDTDCFGRDNDPVDNQGHGTHCAGIAAAVTNNTNQIASICPNCKIMPVRAGYKCSGGTCPSGGSLDVDDVGLAIRYAADNNATIISMSFGGSFSQTIRNAVNYAESKGVIMVASAGNSDSSIEDYPAAEPNVVSVGSTDSNDVKSYFSNYGDWVDIVAPGSSILSTYLNNQTQTLSGTSMSAPLAAGSLGLIKSALPNENQTTILNALNSTGTLVDFVGQNKSRINVYFALLSLDSIAPSITLTDPANQTQLTNVNQTFVCNYTDWQLKNATFHLYNSTDLINQTEFNLTGVENSTSILIENLSEGEYSWSCSSYDNQSNFAIASNNTFTIADIFVTQESPQNQTFTTVNEIGFNCSAIASSGLSNMTFYIYNLTDLIYNETKDITGTENSTVFNYTLLNETAYNWNCEASNNYVEKTSNFTIIYDITSPLIENLTNTPSYNLATIVFDTGEAVNYSLNYSGENVNSSGYSLNPSVSITGLTALTSYMYNLTICDQAGNCNSTNSSFTTTAAPVVSSGGGGSSRSSSGGSSSVEGSLANPVSFEKIRSDGYTHTYGVKTSKYFKDASNNTHNITLDNLIQGIAVITIQTDPITTYLLSNQSYKINLTSADYYDTEIKTGEVSLLLAEITVVAINETIPKPVVYHTTDNETAVAQNNATISFEKIIEYKYFSYIIGLVFIFTLIVLLSKLLKRKKTIEEYDKKQDTKVKTKRKR